MGIYLVNLYGAYCGLREARNLETATRQAMREEGTNNVQSVRKATPEDIENVRAMGGWVPESARTPRVTRKPKTKTFSGPIR